MKKFLVAMVALSSMVSMTALSGCSQTDQRRFNEITNITYTGDTKQDLASLCKVGSFLNGLDNRQRDYVQDNVLKVIRDFDNSNDERIDKVLQALEFLTSTDQDLRAQGEKALAETCTKF